MTRYSNPLPHSQAPNAQGHAAAPANGHAPQSNGHRTEPDFSAWPAATVPRTGGRPAAPAYAPEPAAYGEAQPHAHADTYAALRPDGFGYAPPPQQQKSASDPYALAGYTAPQSAPAAGSYARAPQPAPGYPQQNDIYGTAGGYAPAAHQPAPGQAQAAPRPASSNQPQAYGAGSQGLGYGHSPSTAPSYGSGYGTPAPAAPSPAQSFADQWGLPASAAPQQANLAVDARDYGHAYHPGQEFGTADHAAHQAHAHQAQWGHEAAYGDPAFDPSLGPALGLPDSAAHHGYAQHPQQGAFDQSYAEDDGVYEDAPRGGGWKKVVGLLACTVLIGGVLTIAYSSIMSTDTGDPAPLVKGAAGPVKVKPSDPGGKQFAHADSKIMGRLGEGQSEASDPSGVRKVPVVVVGRDGSIQPPAATAAADETRAVVAVPGLTVIDGLDGPSPTRPAAPAADRKGPPVQMVTATGADKAPPAADTPASKKAEQPPETAALPVKAKEKPAPVKKKQVAAVDPAPTGPKPTGAGYVAVLASVPASGSSRMDALKQFADMQQKYSSILTSKTPDIQEANLGERGTYHRLMVGPPGSRDSANSVCAQLKAQGYSGCWVTAY